MPKEGVRNTPGTRNAAQKEDNCYRAAQKKSCHNVRGVVLVVHNSRCRNHPGNAKLHRPHKHSCMWLAALPSESTRLLAAKGLSQDAKSAHTSLRTNTDNVLRIRQVLARQNLVAAAMLLHSHLF